ncbi:unnamed protein product [marine sediment metagenome]|uniref:Endonuclease/exonuclease/phosphatase domain-containing protein n=1 Tax=marine sediment metagenome TaxID=412755 RepID=X0ZTW3_9ZZZZ
MVEYYISWWNVENLFDVESSPERFPKLDRILKKELQGWDANVLEQKLLQLAKVIQKLNDNNVCKP